ncbi:MAG: N-6 DNA methylase [Methanophagales archaeon]|nr:N-6 DNA methylase [Methanophagales archaeon]
MPKKVRHDLGEYFTPDWLAELVLKEVEYDGDLEKRVLDPACGSGTFLVLAIKEVKNYAEEHFVTDKRELLRKIFIPKFNSKSLFPQRLSALSKKAHALAKRYYELNDLEAREKLKEAEEEIDRAVTGLYGITDEELEEVKKAVKVLKGENVE